MKSLSFILDEVHLAQTNYDKCMYTDPTGAHCRYLWELLESAVTEEVVC